MANLMLMLLAWVSCSAGLEWDNVAQGLLRYKRSTTAQQKCSIHHECGPDEICSQMGCQRVECTSDSVCQTQAVLPSACNSGLCRPKICQNDADCVKAGPNYKCFLDQTCKPTYGTCIDSCSCVQERNLANIEAKCRGGNCFCRSQNVSSCFCSGQPSSFAGGCLAPSIRLLGSPATAPSPGPPMPPSPAAPPTAPSPPALSPHPAPPPQSAGAPPPSPGGSSSTPCPHGHQPGSSPAPGCPSSSPDTPGNQGPGKPCQFHGSCTPFTKTICALKNSAPSGTCKQVKCSSEADCKSETDLGAKCTSGVCSQSNCYEHDDCGKGYGCDSDGFCKKNLGSCSLDCDCGNCQLAVCFKNVCFCQFETENCIINPGPAYKPFSA